MKLAQSKLTAQGQISVPAEVRKRLGVGPGAMIEWIEEDGKLTVRRAGSSSLEELHKLLFPNGPPKYVKDPRGEGMRIHVRKKFGRPRARD